MATTSAADQFRQLRAENRLRLERLRAARLDAAERRTARRRDLTESLSLDWVTPYADLFDAFRQTADPVLSGPASFWQRRRGQNWPIYQTEQELALLRAPARLLMATNGYAQGLVEGLTSYVVGSGCTFRIARRQERDARATAELLDAAQAATDAILKENQWHGGESPGMEDELVGRSIEDGEWVLAHFPQEDGTCEFRVQEPEQLTQPPGSDPEYSFGVLTPPHDTAKPRRYYLQHGDTPEQGDEYEPEEVTHFRRNVRRNMKRGITDFCFDTYDALHLASRLRTNLGDTAAQQASIVAVRQWEHAGQSDVEAFVDEDADFSRTEPLSGRTEAVKVRRRGGWEDVPKGLNYIAGPIANSSPIHIQVLDACLRGGGQRWQAPPWLMSGDLNAMNYATSLTAESPFVKTIQRRQPQYCEAFRRPVWFALAHRVRVRGLRDRTGRVWQWEEVEGLIELVVTAPDPQTRDKMQEAQRGKVEIEMGVQSPQGYMQEQGRDPDQVEADNKEWAAKQPPPQPGGPAAPPGAAPAVPDPLAGLGGGLTESLDLLESLAATGRDLFETLGSVVGLPVAESSPLARVRQLLEAGFTGTVRASNGAVYHYIDGRRVAGNKVKTGWGGQHTDAPKSQHEAEAHVRGLLMGGKPLSLGQVKSVAANMRHMTVPQIRKLKAELKAAGHPVMSAKLKQEQIDAITAFAQASAGPSPSPPPPPADPAEQPADTLPKATAAERRRKDMLARAATIPVTDQPYSGSAKNPPQWERKGDDRTLAFKTSGGQFYRADISPAFKLGDGVGDVFGFVFADKQGSFDVTGAGGAHEVFATVTAAAAAVVTKTNPAGLYFTAAEPSRVRLYDRLVRSMASAVPGYTAMYTDHGDLGRKYILVKDEHADAAKSRLERHGHRAQPLVLESEQPAQPPSRVVIMAPEIDPDWFTPEGWPPLDTNPPADQPAPSE